MSTWGDKLQKVSAKALNSFAEKEFAMETVYEACLERAGLGFTSADIRPSIAVNVQDCEVVKELLVTLAREKVCHEWVPILEGADVRYSALRISWERRR